MKAIILADSRTLKLTPFSLVKPVALLKINGKTILENMINILKKENVDDITVVTGYKHELFDEYKTKLGFKNVVHKDYYTKNTSASLKLVIDEIEKGTIILNGDMFLEDNFFKYIRPDISQFLSQKIIDNAVSFGYISDRNSKLVDIDANATNGYGDGIAILDNEEDIEVLKTELMNIPDYDAWEYCILNSIDKINFYVFDHDNLYTRINSFGDALYHDNLLTPKELAEQCSDNDRAEKLGGITNINYKIKFLGQDKVIRIPGKGTECIIDRNAEKKILNIIYDKDIVPKSEFYDSDLKLTDFLKGYRNLEFHDIKNDFDVVLPLIIEQMKKLHSLKHEDFESFKTISIVEQINNYERLAKIQLVTRLEHKFILDLARKIDNSPKVLCHMDLQLPNIMYNGKDIKFVDFEYAGFSSIIWELGNFTAELELNQKQIEKVINLYGDITYREIMIGQLISNYVWALWGWICDHISLGRNYLTRFHANMNIFDD